MNSLKIMLVVCAFVTVSQRVWSAELQTNEVLTVILELVDGSRVIGTPGVDTVAVQTSYAKMSVPLKQILTIKMGEDHETAAISLQNGDMLKGVIGLGPMQIDTVFGKVSVGIEHVREFRIVPGGGVLPAGEGPLAFGGVNWMAWRTLFEVQGDTLVSMPKVRPGFSYGHGGNGRGPGIMTNIGDANWKDYSVEFDFCMKGVDPALNPHGLPLEFRGGAVMFHVADAKESWNECGWSGYSLGFSSDGTWSLGCTYNQYCRVPNGYRNPLNDGERKLAEGKGLTLNPKNGNRIRIEVCGTRIQIWVDNNKIVDLRDEKMIDPIGGKTLDHGGVGMGGGHDCMIWIRNFSARRL